MNAAITPLNAANGKLNMQRVFGRPIQLHEIEGPVGGFPKLSALVLETGIWKKKAPACAQHPVGCWVFSPQTQPVGPGGAGDRSPVLHPPTLTLAR
jgi:hypothetical protein